MPGRMRYVIKDGKPRAECGECDWKYVREPSGESIYSAGESHLEEEHS